MRHASPMAWSTSAWRAASSRALRVPEVTAIFWIVKGLSTAMGESTSDYLVHNVNPYLAVLRRISDGKIVARSRVVVHAIHIAETNVPGEVVNIAGITGGDVYGVNDPNALDLVFQKIDKMQQTKMVQLAPDTLDDFRPYCLAGLSLAGLATLSLFGLRFTPW